MNAIESDVTKSEKNSLTFRENVHLFSCRALDEKIDAISVFENEAAASSWLALA